MDEDQKPKKKRRTISEKAASIRKRILSHKLLSGLLDGEGVNDDSVGLMKKVLKRLDKDLEDPSPLIAHAAIDKVIKLIPFVIAKDRAPAINLITGPGTKVEGGNNMLVAQTINQYLENRDKEMAVQSGVEQAQLIEQETGMPVEIELKEDVNGIEIEEASEIPFVEGQSLEEEPEIEIEIGTKQRGRED